MRASCVCLVLVLAGTAHSAHAAGYTLSPFKIDGNPNVSIAGINDFGVVTGRYVSTAKPHGAGFVGKKGAVVTLPKTAHSILENLGIPYPSAINDAGAVIGTYVFGSTYVFVWQNDRYVATGLGLGETFAPGIPPPAIAANGDLSFNVGEGDGVVVSYAGTRRAQSQVATGGFPLVVSVNSHLQIAGVYDDVTLTAAVFLGTTSHVQPLLPPQATASFGGWINEAGQVAGSYTTKTALRGFVYTNGTYRTFALPTTPTALSVQGIDDHARVVGTYTDAAGQYAFSASHGQVHQLASFSAGDAVHVAISQRTDQIAISDTNTSGESRSYLVTCTGAGC